MSMKEEFQKEWMKNKDYQEHPKAYRKEIAMDELLQHAISQAVQNTLEKVREEGFEKGEIKHRKDKDVWVRTLCNPGITTYSFLRNHYAIVLGDEDQKDMQYLPKYTCLQSEDDSYKLVYLHDRWGFVSTSENDAFYHIAYEKKFFSFLYPNGAFKWCVTQSTLMKALIREFQRQGEQEGVTFTFYARLVGEYYKNNVCYPLAVDCYHFDEWKDFEYQDEYYNVNTIYADLQLMCDLEITLS